jgi:hypothetical protein
MVFGFNPPSSSSLLGENFVAAGYSRILEYRGKPGKRVGSFLLLNLQNPDYFFHFRYFADGIEDCEAN